MSKTIFVLIATGTTGDFLPLLGIAEELNKRMLSTVLIANEYFQGLAKNKGGVFISSGPKEEYLAPNRTDTTETNQKKKAKRVSLFNHYHLPAVSREYNIIHDIYNKNKNIVVICTSGENGGYFACKKFDIPFVLMVLAPSYLREKIDLKVELKNKSIFRMSRYYLEKFFIVPAYRTSSFFIRQGSLNRIRESIGLKKISFLSYIFCQSSDTLVQPKLVFGCFPAWFGNSNFKARSDIPIHLIGFPYVNSEKDSDLTDRLSTFISKYGKPIAFFPGSGAINIEPFVNDALIMLKHLNAPGIFISSSEQLLGLELPSNIIKISYSPLEHILPYCQAVVHHGGIGTIAEAIRAGIPQVVRAVEYDQPYNGHLLCRMGIATAKLYSEFDATKMAIGLNKLQNSSSTTQKLNDYSLMTKNSNAVKVACDLLEQFSAAD